VGAVVDDAYGRRVTRREVLTGGAKLAAGSAAIWTLGRSVLSANAATATKTIEVFGPPYDFTDAFYLANGIDPSKILMRVDGTPPDSTTAPRQDPFPGYSFASDTDPKFNRNVRVLNHTGGYDFAGNIEYYWVNGMLMPDTFTNDAAGQEARGIADSFAAYLFPKASGDPFGLDVTNRRQDNVFGDADPAYDADVLGLWVATFVSYTPAALTTPQGKALLERLARKNGRDLDGTPIIKRVKEVELLHELGFVDLRTRPSDGSLGPPWVI
jgi:hypothetical protein